MALKIKKTSENGIVTTYHKIASVNIQFFENEKTRVIAILHHYANDGYREKNGDLNADSTTKVFSFTEEQVNGNLREVIYNALKETEEYKDAEDV